MYERMELVGGAAATTLSGNITSGDLAISLAAATGWPTGASGKFVIVINRTGANAEKIRVTSRAGTGLTVGAGDRGYDGTTAGSHTAGESVEVCISAGLVDEANYVVSKLIGNLTAKGMVAVGSAANVPTMLAVGTDNQLLVADSTQTTGVKWGAIPNSAIATSAMFASSVVATAAIQDLAVSTGKIADSAVTSAKIADGTITGTDIAAGTVTSSNLVDLTVATGDIADTAITAAKLAAAVAGDGLAGGAGTALSVNVDASTIEINTDILRVKDAGITTAKLAATPSCSLYRDNTSPLSCSSSWQSITFSSAVGSSEDWDDFAMHDLVTNAARVTIPAGYGGKYRLTVWAQFENLASDWLGLGVSVNGFTTTPDHVLSVTPDAATVPRVTASRTLILAAGDYVTFEVAAGNATLMDYARFQVEYVRS